jgi:hypothetical protein
MSNKSDFPIYRKDETNRLFICMKGGESASVVGVSGVGKSNLFNQLLDPRVQSSFIGEDYLNYFIVRVDCHYLTDLTDRSIYSLILEQLETLDSQEQNYPIEKNQIQEITQNFEALLESGNDPLKNQRFFKLAIRSLLRPKEKHIVLLLDQFDDVFRDADPMIFRNLRGLRETYKYRVSFITFTRDTLPRITELDAGREEYFELLESNIIWLKPYNEEDSSRLIKRIANRYHIDVDNNLEEGLFYLTHGHAGLLRECLLSISRSNIKIVADMESAISLLNSKSAVLLECRKIWNSISVKEKKYLFAIVQGRVHKNFGEIQTMLAEKGLILNDVHQTKVFSPIFGAFIENQEPLWEHSIFLDEAVHVVWVLGQSTPLLTAQEYRLFLSLYKRKDEVVTKDELVDAGWPNSKGGVTDEALMVAVSRLRKKIEPDPDNPRFIENVREHGYILNSS